jgi:hypothetical protein
MVIKLFWKSGAGTEGKFVVGETITGGTSKATAKILVDDLGNTTTPRIFITSQQKFVTGETITGGTSLFKCSSYKVSCKPCTDHTTTVSPTQISITLSMIS